MTIGELKRLAKEKLKDNFFNTIIATCIAMNMHSIHTFSLSYSVALLVLF